MTLTIAEKDAVREKELQDIIVKAIEVGENYSAFSRRAFSDGTKIRTFVERAYGGIIPYCELYDLPIDKLVTVNNLVGYNASKLTEQEVLSQIKELHKGLDRGLMEKDVKKTVKGRILVAASRRLFGYWDEALLLVGIQPARANQNMIDKHTSEIIELYSNGMPMRKISESVPVGVTTIKRILVDNGFKITPATEWSIINNPILYKKQDVDLFVAQIIRDAVDTKFTVIDIKKLDAEMYRAIKEYYGTFANAVKLSGEYVLNKGVPRKWDKDFLISQIKLAVDNGEILNTVYLNNNNGASAITYGRDEFGSWENALIAAGVDLESVYLGMSAFVKLGFQFEQTIGNILTELSMGNKDEMAHERWKPDFVLGSKWIDAKLSMYTHLGKDKNGLTVIEKYEPCCDELELVFLRGNYGTYRKVSDKTTLIHVSHYVNKLPKDRQEYYNAILTQIELEANSIVYEEGA